MPAPPKKPKQKSFKKPRRINSVTIGLILLAGALGYLGYCYGPVYLDHYQVKNLAYECASRYYKLSFLEETARNEAANELVAEIRRKVITALDYEDPEMIVDLQLGDEAKKKVFCVVEYSRQVELKGLDKIKVVHFKAVGESDYVNTGN